jgi:catechol 2,3-dioxygenase-like lactoylglutathione lyase family enzyme
MLGDRPVHTTFTAKEIERAKQFYRGMLGISVESEEPGDIFFQSGNTHLLVFPTTGVASGSHTQMGWVVDDIETEVADLTLRGVAFEQYDSPGFDTATNIITSGPIKAAWFKDSEGNLLGLVQLP